MLWSAPVLDALQQPARWFEEARLWLGKKQHLQQQNRQLRQKLAQQASLYQQVKSLQEDNRQLRQLLHVRQLHGYQWQAARVLGYSPDAKNRRLLLRIEGTRADDVVVSDEGLVGLVAHQTAEYAVVRTILDASLAVPLTTEDGRLIALGRSNGLELRVDFVAATSSLEVGDILQTSGAGGIYPPGIKVARVRQVEPRKGSPFLMVTATPLAHWQGKRWLAVARNP